LWRIFYVPQQAEKVGIRHKFLYGFGGIKDVVNEIPGKNQLLFWHFLPIG
jgi:hypothetical protein